MNTLLTNGVHNLKFRVFFSGCILWFIWSTAFGDLVRMDEKSYACRILVEKFPRKKCALKNEKEIRR
jgi:hypothetical protein